MMGLPFKIVCRKIRLIWDYKVSLLMVINKYGVVGMIEIMDYGDMHVVNPQRNLHIAIFKSDLILDISK